MQNKCTIYFIIFAFIINFSLSDLFDENNIAEKEYFQNIQTLDYLERSKGDLSKWMNNDVKLIDNNIRNRRHIELAAESGRSIFSGQMHRSQQNQKIPKFNSFKQKILRSRAKKTKKAPIVTKPSKHLIHKKNMFQKAKPGLNRKRTTLKPKPKNKYKKNKYILTKPKNYHDKLKSHKKSRINTT